jgi:DNA repair protein RadC
MRTQFVKLALVCERPAEYSTRLNCAVEVARIIGNLIRDDATESFFVVACDPKLRINAIATVATGGGDGVSIYMADIFKPALLANASAIFIVHNHPSGDVDPSTEDAQLTHRVKEAAKILGIRFLDHLILAHGGGKFYSFSEAGRV